MVEKQAADQGFPATVFYSANLLQWHIRE